MAHWLAHALVLLTGNEIVEIWDRTLPTGTRHVWPTLRRADGIWLIQIEGQQRPFARPLSQAANLGWEDAFGFLHLAGKETLGLFLGNDRAAPIVQFSERAWGSNIADWSKGPSVLGTSIGEPVRQNLKSDTPQATDPKPKADTKKESGQSAGKPSDDKKESRRDAADGASAPPSGEKKTDGQVAQPSKAATPRPSAGMNWNDV